MDAADENRDTIIAWRSRCLPMCNAALNLARSSYRGVVEHAHLIATQPAWRGIIGALLRAAIALLDLLPLPTWNVETYFRIFGASCPIGD